jgi:Flp pilus assembly protein TadG
MAKQRHNRLKARTKRGTAAIEYAIILPVLLLLLLGIMDLGRLMWIYTGLNRGVEAAARCGAVNTNACATTAAVQAVAAAEVWGATVPSSVFTVSTASCGMQVSASYNFTFFTPGVSAITLAPSACFTSLH